MLSELYSQCSSCQLLQSVNHLSVCSFGKKHDYVYSQYTITVVTLSEISDRVSDSLQGPSEPEFYGDIVYKFKTNCR